MGQGCCFAICQRLALFIKDILFTLYMYINIFGVFKFIVMDILGMIFGVSVHNFIICHCFSKHAGCLMFRVKDRLGKLSDSVYKMVFKTSIVYPKGH